MRIYPKGPNDTKEYSFDYTYDLLSGDRIVSSSWILGSGLTSESEAYTEFLTSIIVSGGVPGSSYKISNTVRTADGKEYTKSFYFRIMEC